MLYNDQLLKNVDSGSNESVDFLQSFMQMYGSSGTFHNPPSEKDLKAFCASHPSMKPVWCFLCSLMKQKQSPLSRRSSVNKIINMNEFGTEEVEDNDRTIIGTLHPPREKRTKSRKAHCRELRDSINLLEQKMKALSRDISAKSQSKVDEETKRETGLTSLLAWGGYTCTLTQRKKTIALMKGSFTHLNAAQESSFCPDTLGRARKSMQEILSQSELMETTDEKALITWKMRTRKDCSEKFKAIMHTNDENKDLLDACGCNANINKFICTLEKGYKPDTSSFSIETATNDAMKRLGFTRTPGLSYENEIQKIFAERVEKDKRIKANIQKAEDNTDNDVEGKKIVELVGSDPKKIINALKVCRRHAAILDSKVKALSPYVAMYEKVGGMRVTLKELNERRAALIKGLAQIVSDELSRLFAVKKSIVKMESKTLIPKIQAAIGNIETFSKLGVPFFVISSLENTDWSSWVRQEGRGLNSCILTNRRALARVAGGSVWEVPPMDFVGWSARLMQEERSKAFPKILSDYSLDSLVDTARDTIMCCEKHDKEIVRGKWCTILEALVEDILENGERKLHKMIVQLHNEWQTSPGAFCLSWVTVDGLTFSQWLSSWKERCLQGRTNYTLNLN